MQTEYEKMLAGELYNGEVEELIQLRLKARDWMTKYNQTSYNREKRFEMLQQIFGKIGKHTHIEAPFFCDYGCHIEVGEYFFANFNCVFLDCNHIKIGDNVFIGPSVQIYAAHHPLVASERIKGLEYAFPVTIGNNVWIGGSSVICAGVTIGDNVTIGAGSVVVKDIPANVLAVGNPCRPIRNL